MKVQNLVIEIRPDGVKSGGGGGLSNFKIEQGYMYNVRLIANYNVARYIWLDITSLVSVYGYINTDQYLSLHTSTV